MSKIDPLIVKTYSIPLSVDRTVREEAAKRGCSQSRFVAAAVREAVSEAVDRPKQGS
jgi:hypothetical protein